MVFMDITATHATDRFLGVCGHCDTPIAIEDRDVTGSPAIVGSDIRKVTCPDCGTYGIRLERLYSTLVTDIACHSACQSATGPTCECSCGGANHGIGFVVGRGFDTAANIAKFKASRVKRAATVEAKRQAKAEAEVAAKLAWISDNADVVAYLRNYQGQNEFLVSVSDQLARKNSLSDKQAAAVRRYIDGEAKRSAAIAARKAEEALTAKPAPTGRVNLTGEVLTVKEQFGDYGLQIKILVKADGFKVWSTLPRDIERAIFGERFGVYETNEATRLALKGRTVTFTATLKPSNDDPSFAFASRPAKGSLAPAEAKQEVSV